MESLIDRTKYTPEQALAIETMGSMAVSVANRWQAGWPTRVTTLLNNNTYMQALQQQVELEKDVLANETDLRHLARHEILAHHEIRQDPPTAE
mgnify:CR=1 FL=1